MSPNQTIAWKYNKKGILSSTAACSAFQRVVYLNVAAGGPKEKEARDEEKKGGGAVW